MRDRPIGSATSNAFSGSSARQRPISVTRQESSLASSDVLESVRRNAPHRPAKQGRARVKSLLKNERCILLRERLLDDPDFASVGDEDLKRLISHLREYTRFCAIQEYYYHALQSQSLLDSAREELGMRIEANCPSDDLVRALEKSRARFARSSSDSREQYELETNEKREAILSQHRHETRVFERQWRRSKPHKYRKSSHLLIQLRQIEKTLAVETEIEKAMSIHAQVWDRTEIEAECAQQNLIRDYRVAREKHLHRQASELDRFEQQREEGARILEAKLRAKEQPLIHRDAVVRAKTACAVAKPRAADDRPVTSAGVPKQRHVEIEMLLPELVPPNDPVVKEFEMESARHTSTAM
jgi:hypothetical protein